MVISSMTVHVEQWDGMGLQIQNFSWQNNAEQMEKSENRTPQNSALRKKVPGLSPFSP